ncbi:MULTISPECIES: phosphate ABC transporter substrate-binding protein PstS [Streptomyces]|uniref:Phosphate-binding protein n=5 Tax=Streptomyces TaxID=1883 RepID=A0A8H9HYH1_9ACTN|nr:MULTISPECIES: phosphate ABC transporter substrate-binding protein PstS [Streptomyces]NEE42164.1 phosphate ABC transporter substrate-binding protein PstS [Streptomyces sp. SID7982]NEE57177.1 phosphate ABC transporter substrate-binding protein PstS [Streptomyces sp. SID8455]MBL3805456.1 phosphate ABC transporter substrate-binding protein PstS [Streptomyces sp. BRB081]MDQ0294255.1 phosphate transport system substrate-binding protein [Streptomyces sp. DSM 41037]PJM80436.1 phosphate ABC transpor
MKLQRKNRARALTLGALALSGALALTACGSDDTGGTTGGSGEASASAADVECGKGGQLLASGSSAQKNAMDVWIKNYRAACPDTQINYKPDGSGAGVTAFLQGQTAFAGSDSALKPEEIEKSAEVCKDSQAIDLPMLGGPIALGYNVPGVDKLNLDAATLADIFNDKITTWDDEAIKKLNPDAELPDTKIQAFHRSDESGTTDNFTKYLKAAAPKNWPHEPGKAWEAKGGQSAQGSSGVAQQVKQTAGAISYFELSYATDGIKTVDLDTGAGTPVEATVDNASKAISEAKVVGQGKDLALELAYDTKAEGAYPITLVTYEIACEKGNKAETLDATKSFLGYIASEDGQNLLKKDGYAPLPAEIAEKVRTTIADLG